MLENNAKAKLTNIRVSPRKLNLVAAAIRGMTAEKAMNYLTFSRKRISTEVRKTLASAIANAENNHGLDIDRLVVSEAYVGTGMKLKRFQARGRGKASSIEKPFSHLSIVLVERGID
ncbi:MAG: 50S ribosomal protein L22 [Candidatus Paracaedibacteraceae bacterium]|nr:50S ribosomal protein L22 [Candidatus Paracaedibacteraceae bacterium]